MTPVCDTTKLREIFARGLIAGVGDESQTCVEGAISLACGLPLSDTPPCVAAEDRAFAIRLNDAQWSSPQARSEALLPLALAQIGTAGKSRKRWVARVWLGTVRAILPVALRAAASVHPYKTHAAALEAAAVRCEGATSRTAKGAAEAAACAATDATYDAGNAAHASAASAANAANAANTAVASNAAACAAANAANAAVCAAGAAKTERDRILRLAVKVALDAYAAEGRHVWPKGDARG